MDGLAIVTQGLTKIYNNIPAVNNLDLQIPQGTVFGFLGPNGAGKTTTIRMLLGLINPTAGSAKVLGNDIQRERSKIASQVGAIVESPAFYTYLTGLENLHLFAKSSGLDLPKTKFSELLEFVGLLGRENDKVKTYSLGMKQRLGVAATLLNDPKIVFLDEPTNGLDPAGTVDMRNLITRLGHEGRTVFLSSHLLHEVQQVCSDVAIIQRGITIKQGRVQDLVSDGSGYAFEVSPFEKAMSIFVRHPELNATSNDSHWITVQAQPNDVPELVRALVDADVDVYQVQLRQKSLESLFLELTGPAGHVAPLPEPVEVA